jgi:hypothetical protein
MRVANAVLHAEASTDSTRAIKPGEIMLITLLHDASILRSCHRACPLRHLAGPWQLNVQRPFDLANDLYDWDRLAILEPPSPAPLRQS